MSAPQPSIRSSIRACNRMSDVRSILPSWKVTVMAIFVTVVAITPGEAIAQSDTTSGRILARIDNPIAVSEVREMSFAWMASPASPGTASPAQGDRAASSSLALANPDASTPAVIVITGTPNQTVALLIADSANFGGVRRKISVSSFTHDGGVSPALGPNGKATVKLGATPYIADDAGYGAYRGAFDVIVSNN